MNDDLSGQAAVARLRPASPRTDAIAYLVAAGLAALTVLAGWALDPSAPRRPLLALFAMPVLFSTIRGGLGPGLVATALLSVASAPIALPPGPASSGASGVVPWVVSSLVGVVLALAVAEERRTRLRTSAAQQPTRNLLARQLQVSAIEAEATRFRRFARDAPIGIVFIGNDGKVQFANDEYLRIVHLSREEFESERFRSEGSVPAEWLQSGLGARRECEFVRSDGTRVPVLVGLSSQQDGVAAFVVDLTSEKASQRAREQSEERYRTIAEKLAEADRRKDEFLSVLSHELRNPLAPIRNAVYLLRRCDPASDAARREKILTIVERQVDHLTRLVDDLLDVTRITRGLVDLRRERVDLSELLRRTGDDHHALAQQRGVELHVRVPADATWVEGDPTRLMQIVGNLLQNAVKFSRDGGEVTLALRADGVWAEVLVTDTGVGIDADLLAHVFEPFVQAERTLARSDGGLGLGLALVRKLTEMHGGGVRASSAGPGQGAEFVVRLPLAPAERQADRASTCAVALPRRRSRVLVIEDNPDVAESLRELVEAFGHDVEVAYTGSAALAKARVNPPDVVLCDIGLPGMSGYEVARAFRGDPSLRGVRLVAVSGYAQPEDRRESVEAGFDRHVAKPTDPGELERLLAS